MSLSLLFIMCVKELHKIVLIDSDGTVNKTTINDTINSLAGNYDSFMCSHKTIQLMFNNIYYSIYK